MRTIMETLTDNDIRLLKAMFPGGYRWAVKASNGTLQFFVSKPHKADSWGMDFWKSSEGEISLNIDARFSMKMITSDDAKPLKICKALWNKEVN